MDASAFLALPASDFPIPPDSLPEVAEHNGDATEGGVFSHHAHAPEGERRRKEMLAVACSLEERYRTLLNPDKKSSGKRFTRVESAIIEHALAESVSDAEEGEEEVEETEEEEEEEEVDELEEEEVEDEPPSPRRPSYHDESGESEVDEEERDRRRSKGLKLKIKFSVRTPPQTKGTLPKPTKKISRHRLRCRRSCRSLQRALLYLIKRWTTKGSRARLKDPQRQRRRLS